ncbi:MAG: NPCBM/NEW2 domain-containing protein [Planctomycetota bacterium]
MNFSHIELLRSWFRSTSLSLLIFAIVTVSANRVTAQSQSGQPSGEQTNIVAKLLLRSGQTQTGTLVSLNEDSLRLADASSTPVPFAQIESLTFVSDDEPSEESPAAKRSIEFVDGTRIAIATVSMADNVLKFSLADRDQQASSRHVKLIQLKQYEDAFQQKRLDRAVKEYELTTDALVVDRDNSINFVEGIVRGMADERIEFSVGTRSAQIGIEKLEAVAFFHAVNREFEAAPVRVTLNDESQLQLRRLKFDQQTKPDEIELVTLAGPTFRVPIAALNKIEFGSSSTIALSDLAPATNDWKPLIASPAILDTLRQLRVAKNDADFAGEPLQLEYAQSGEYKRRTLKTFNKGFAMTAGGKLSFALEKQFASCRGLIGFAPDADNNGNVRVRIGVDGTEVFRTEMAKQTMNQPVKIDINVAGGSRMVIEVDYLDGRSVGDQIHLVDLQLKR